MRERLTEDQLDEIEREALKPYRQITLPTMHVRQMIEEIHALRDAVIMLEARVDGGKAIVDAVEAATRYDIDTKLSAIKIQRLDGPSFRLVDAILATKAKS